MKKTFLFKHYLMFSFWTLIFFYIIALFIGPRVVDEEQKVFCVRNFEINNFFGHSMNCDSAGFMSNAFKVEELFDTDSIRQNRPGIIFSANIIFKSFYFFLEKKVNLSDSLKAKLMYSSFIFLNSILMFGTLFFFFKLFNLSVFKAQSYLNYFIWLSLLLIVNNIYKQFFWSPHTQLFLIFGGVLTFFFSKKIYELKKFDFQFFLFSSIILGIFLLFYGYFVISYLNILILFAIRNFNYISLKKLISICFSSFIFFILPYITWFYFVFSFSGNFYNHEIEQYRYFIWVIEKYNNFGFIDVLIALRNIFFEIITSFFTQFCIMIGAIFIIIYNFKNKIEFKNNLNFVCIVYSLIYLTFFTLCGLSSERIATGLIVPLVIFTCNIINDLSKEKYFFHLLIIVLISYSSWSVIKFGPYS